MTEKSGSSFANRCPVAEPLLCSSPLNLSVGWPPHYPGLDKTS